MAAVTEINLDAGDANRHVRLFKWTLTQADPTGDAIQMPSHADRSIQVSQTGDTFGIGVVELRGSLKPNASASTDFFRLSDPQANPISIATGSAAKIEAIMEPTLWIQPYLSAADGTTSLTVYLLARK